MPIPVHSHIHTTQSPTTPLRNSQPEEHSNKGDPQCYGFAWSNIGNLTSIGRDGNIRYTISSNVKIPRMARVAPRLLFPCVSIIQKMDWGYIFFN